MLSDDIVVSSTTDTQEDVNAAAGVETPVETPKQAAEGEEPGTSAESAPAPKEKPEPDPWAGVPKGARKRIEKLTAQNHALLERLEEIDRRTAPRTEEPKPAVAAGPDKGPKPEDFKGRPYEDYLDARAKWVTKQALAEERAAEAQKSEADRQQQTFDAFNTAADEFRSEHPDYDAVLQANDHAIHESVKLALIEMDNGPEVAYYIASHPEFAQEMLDVPPLRAVGMAWAKSNELSPAKGKAVPSKPAPRTAAPAPITPPKSASTSSSVPLDELPYNEFKKARAQGRTN